MSVKNTLRYEIVKWSDIPIESHRYVVYHTFISPLLITWYMLPVYMFMTGYSVLEIEALFTLVNVTLIGR
ncbi:MAG: hypothetical protein QXP80_06545 [Zestosphaera sp.]